MIQKIIYCCERCNAEFYSFDECEEHEASHYSLSLLDYQSWKHRTRILITAGKQFAKGCTPRNKQIFDSALEVLMNFEKSHGLECMSKPNHFLTGGD